MNTDYRLWLIFTSVIFILLGFVRLHYEGVEYKIGPTSFWRVVYYSSQYPNYGIALAVMALVGGFIAIPAVVLGWVGQAIVVALRRIRHPEKQNPISN